QGGLVPPRTMDVVEESLNDVDRLQLFAVFAPELVGHQGAEPRADDNPNRLAAPPRATRLAAEPELVALRDQQRTVRPRGDPVDTVDGLDEEVSLAVVVLRV